MPKASMQFLVLFLLSSIALVFSETEPTRITLKPDAAPESLKIKYIQEVGSCSYKVTIGTSCVSPLFTTDEIGILFGDDHGNQIIELKLENGEEAFDSCRTDNFILKDRPCCDQISYMFIYKNGADNWLPSSVEVSASDFNPLLFVFNSSIPEKTWYGFDLRQFAPPPPPKPILPPPPHHSPPPPEPILPPPPIVPPPPSASGKISGQKSVVFVILGVLNVVTLGL